MEKILSIPLLTPISVEKFDVVEVLGTPALIVPTRLFAEDIPDSCCLYYLRGRDDDPMDPCCIEKNVVWVNFTDCVITAKPLDFDGDRFVFTDEDGINYDSSEICDANKYGDFTMSIEEFVKEFCK